MSEVVGAIDGGGTKTLAALAERDGTARIVTWESGCNPQDNPLWLDALTPALEAVLGSSHVTLGLPGFGEIAGLDATIRAEVAARLPAPHTIFNDVEMAAQGAFPSGAGVLILAGTGSMAMAVAPGVLTRAGGWGDGFGDEGSGYWIGREALSIVSKMIDGRLADTGFADALCDRLGPPATSRPFGPMDWLLAHPHGRSAIASVAKHVDALAENGDETAGEILIRAARELAQTGRAAVSRAGLTPDAAWAGAGSVLNSRTLRSALSDRMGRPPVPVALPPLGGGLALAARTAGWPTDADFTSRLNATLVLAMKTLP